jgi:hypothetical protein
LFGKLPTGLDIRTEYVIVPKAGQLGSWTNGQVARLASCRIAGLPDYRIAGLPDYRQASLPACWLAGLPVCWIASLPACWLAGLPVACLPDGHADLLPHQAKGSVRLKVLLVIPGNARLFQSWENACKSQPVWIEKY